MGVTEEAGKVGTSAVEAMKSVPLAIALLLVNACFIGFVAYFVSLVGQNAAARDQQQRSLIEKLVDECRRGPQSSSITWPPLLKLMVENDLRHK